MPWTLYVYERLGLGPSSYLNLLHDAAALVPPGRGYRRGIETLDSARKAHGLTPRRDTTDEAIRRGQRQIAAQSIRQMARNGRIEFYDDDGVQMVRRPLSL